MPSQIRQAKPLEPQNSNPRGAMLYDPAHRILSISYQREPLEHATIVLATHSRSSSLKPVVNRWLLLAMVVAGAVIGIAMEAYRRLVLVPWLDPAVVPPLNVIVLELLPFVLLVVAGLYAARQHLRRLRQRTIANLAEARMLVDTDIFEEGISVSAGPMTTIVDWEAISRLTVSGDRLEFEGESFLAYIPARAFRDRQAFDACASACATRWNRARLKAGLPEIKL